MIQSIASRHPSLTASETNAAVTVSKDGADVNIHPNFVRYLMEFIESYKNEILAASVAASTNQRGDMSSSNQTEFIQNLVKQAVNEGTDRHTADFTRLIEEALDKYSADRIAKPDYALRTSGARIIRFGGLTSPPFGVSGRMINGSSAEETPPPSLIKRIRSYALALIGAIRLPPSKQPVPLSQPPDVVIASTEQQQPGKCWSFAGQRGLLTVMLASAVRPTEVTIEHVPKSVWPDVTLAPRRMQLWGVRFTAQMRQRLTDRRLFVSDDQQLLQFIYNAFASTISDDNPNNADNNNANVTAQLLGSFEYRVDGRSLQTFTLQSSFEEIDIVQLRVLDNYGHPERTCIYRMRVHG
jgi:hypothetical protein